jgi:hypothetical protein
MRTVVVRVAFAAYAVFAVLASAFAAGYALDDPGGLAGAALVAAWLVPMLLLSALALVRGSTGAALASPVTALAVLVLTLMAVTTNLVPERWGPVGAMLCLVVGTFLACLGLSRPGYAAVRLVVLAVATLLTVMLNVVLHQTGLLGAGPGVGASTLATAVPLLLLAIAYTAGRTVPTDDRTRQPASHG